MIAHDDKERALNEVPVNTDKRRPEYKSQFTSEASALFPKTTTLQPSVKPKVTASIPIGGKRHG